MTRPGLRVALFCALLATTALSAPAAAQLAEPAPVRQSIDANGVDLFHGHVSLDAPALTIGGSDGSGLVYYKLTRGKGWTDNIVATLHLNGSLMTVRLGGTSDSFTVSGSTYTPTEGNGASLSFNSTTNIYTYTRSDGTVIRFDRNRRSEPPYYSNEGRVLDIAGPTGEKLVFTYQSLSYCYAWQAGAGGDVCTQTAQTFRIASVRNSFGYRLTFGYAPHDYLYDPTNPSAQPDFALYSTVTGVTADNLAVATSSSRTMTFENAATYNVTDPLGRTTKYRLNGLNVLGITLPGSTSENITYTYSSTTPVRVTGVTTADGTTTYASSDLNGVRTVTATDPLNHATVYKFDIASKRMTSVTDATSRTMGMTYDAQGRLTRITYPEGNYTQITYDTRGNVTERREVSKTPGTPADIVLAADYPDTCTNIVSCNRPVWTKDARGNQTDYSYDPSTGDLTAVTSPAPISGAVRPQVRYGYTALQAYFKNSSGSIVASGEPVRRLTSVSACQTAASCAGAADEVKTTISYGPQSAGTGNNLLPVTVSKGAGNGSVTSTEMHAYDDAGNLISTDGPLSGSGDTTRYRYDAARQLVGTVSPDPDSAGALKPRAVRTTYNDLGRVKKVEAGTVNSQSDADWAAMTVIETADISFDAIGRPVKETLTISGSLQAVSQRRYDAGGRLECVAQRMNPATFASPPSSACTLATQGSHGPDRITKTIYDAAGRVTQVQTAFGVTGQQRNEVTNSYTDNGKLQTVTDGENNRTTYEYDGHDRLVKTRYPSTTKGAQSSSTTDYEQINYGTGGIVSSIRRRNGTTVAFTYDNLGRVTLKNAPGSELDVTYSYDNLSRLTGASQTGNNLTFTYDALGRNKTQGGPLGTVGFEYDAAGRRISMTYPGSGLAVHYEYLVTGEVDKIRENSSSGTVLADYDYDNQGRRQLLTRANGTSTDYEYDAMSRLQSLTENVGGTSHDNNVTFTYTPASEIKTAVRSNDIFAWPGAYNVNRSYTINGLNQVTQATTVGSPTPLTFGYDDNGNLTSSGSTSYTYDSENRLVSASGTSCPTCTGTASLTYDPAGRLYQITGGSVTTRFAYDGGNIIAEYNGSNTLLRRYVFGPGADEALVWYEGSGTTDRRFFHADERGSIVAVSNGSGTVTASQSYDEYGIPASANTTRFQYTGQAWLPELGIYYYKARMYSPTLGRFLQTDPIGYADGMNLYGYVGGDPISNKDPWGLKKQEKPKEKAKGGPADGMPTLPPDGKAHIYPDGQGGTGYYDENAKWVQLTIGGGLSIPGTVIAIGSYAAVDWATVLEAAIGGLLAPPACNQSLVDLGNSLAATSEQLGQASGTAIWIGLAISAGGVVTLQPEILGGGLALTKLGGWGALAAGTLHIGSGIAHGVGGAGWDNAATGSFAMVTGLGMARYMAPAKVSGYRTVSQRAMDNLANNTSIIGGGMYDAITGLGGLGPTEKSCPIQ